MYSIPIFTIQICESVIFICNCFQAGIICASTVFKKKQLHLKKSSFQFKIILQCVIVVEKIKKN